MSHPSERGVGVPGPWAIPLLMGLVVASVLPVLLGEWLPLVDLPQHAAQVALWHWREEVPDFRAHYEIHLESPYVLTYVLWRGLVLAGLEVLDAGRVLVALLMAAVPLSFLWLLRERGRPQEWAFFALPVVHNHSLSYGFLPFYATLPLFLGALALFSRWAERGRWWHATLVAGSGLLILWCHALTAGLWGLTCGLFALLRPGPLLARARLVLPLVPTGLVLGSWAFRARGAGSTQGGGLADRARQFEQMLLGSFTFKVHQVAVWGPRLLVVLLLVAALTAWRNRRTGSTHQGPDLPLLVSGLVCLGLYFFLPFEAFGTFHVNVRFAPFAFLLVAGGMPALPWRLPQVLVPLTLAVITVLVAWRVHGAFQQFQLAVGDATSLFRALPPGASVLQPEGTRAELRPFRYPVLAHFAVYSQLFSRGQTSTFTNASHMLVQESRTDPPPPLDAVISTDKNGDWEVRARNGRLPDALIFPLEGTPPAQITTPEGGAPYRFRLRTGPLCAFVRPAAGAGE